MFSPSVLLRSLTIAALLGSASTVAIAQKHIAAATAPAASTKAAPVTKGPTPIVVESLSGLDLLPNRTTGTFGVRINHHLTQSATLRVIDTKTSRYVVTELLEPSPAPTRAVQVGKLAAGEYKMEVVMPDTTYWKTVRVSMPTKRR